MICENWDPFKKNEREALIKKMVLKRLGDEIRPISYQKFVLFMPERRSGMKKTNFWCEIGRMSSPKRLSTIFLISASRLFF